MPYDSWEFFENYTQDGKSFGVEIVENNMAHNSEEYYLITTPAGIAPILLSVDIGTDAYPFRLDVWEGTLVDDNGVEIDMHNRCRVCVDPCNIHLYHSPAVDVNGQKVYTKITASQHRGHAVAMILKPDENYLLRIKNKSRQYASIVGLHIETVQDSDV